MVDFAETVRRLLVIGCLRRPTVAELFSTVDDTIFGSGKDLVQELDSINITAHLVAVGNEETALFLSRRTRNPELSDVV